MNRPTQNDFCRVVIINEVLGTTEESISAWGVKETLAHHGAVTRAVRWSEDYDLPADHRCYSAFTPTPISVCVTARGNVVTVRWYVTGSPDEAREAMQAVLAGKYGQHDEDEEGGATL